MDRTNIVKVHTSSAKNIILYCFPYSGASANIFTRWRSILAPIIEVHPVELPGRGKRILEPSAIDLSLLANHLAVDIANLLRNRSESDYALFGHSLGSLLSFEVAHALRMLSVRPPVRIFVSGAEAPALRDDSDFRTPKSDVELMAELRKYDGTSDELLDNEDLMSMVLPILRADLLLCGTYSYRCRQVLNCPITTFGGRLDEPTETELQSWARETTGAFELITFDGGHFFVHTHEREVVNHVKSRLLCDLGI